MGCWNGTCFFSGLSILEDDPAVIVPMVVGKLGSQCTWFPIHGKYNDYGGLKEIKSTSLTDKLVSLVKKYGRHGHPGPSPFRDSARLMELANTKDKTTEQVEEHQNLLLEHMKHADKEAVSIRFGSQWEYALNNGKEIESIEDLVNVMERQGCRSDTLEVYVPYLNEWQGIQFVMIHGLVWKRISQYIGKNGMEPGDTSGEDIFDSVLRDRVLPTESAATSNPILKKYFAQEVYRNFKNSILGDSSAGDAPYVDIFKEELWNGCGWTRKSLKGQARKSAKELLFFRLACMVGRRALVPQAGMGSQQQNFEFVKDLAQCTLNICNRTIKKFKEE